MLLVGRIEFRGQHACNVIYHDGTQIFVSPPLATNEDIPSNVEIGRLCLSKVVGCGVQDYPARLFYQECLEPFDGMWSWRHDEILNWWNANFPPDKPGKVVDKKWR